MAILGQTLCGTKTYNQGFGRCTSQFGQLNYLIAIPKGYVIQNSELDNLDNLLREKAYADSPLERWYLVGPFVNFESANTDAPQETFNDNSSVYTGLGQWGWTMRTIAGGSCGYQNLLKLHQTQDAFDFLHIHGTILLAGRKVRDSIGEWGLRGIEYTQLFVPNWIGGNGTALPTHQIMGMVGDSTQVREDYTFVNLRDLDISVTSEMQPLIDVELTAQPVGGNYAINDVTAVTACGGVNLASLYGTELTNINAWRALNEQGQAIPITTVTLSGETFRITVNSASPNYTAGGKYFLQFATLSTLAIIGVTGYEAIPERVDTNPSS